MYSQSETDGRQQEGTLLVGISHSFTDAFGEEPLILRLMQVYKFARETLRIFFSFL